MDKYFPFLLLSALILKLDCFGGIILGGAHQGHVT